MDENFLLLKVAHIFGAMIFLGNIMVSAVWKLMADRSGQPAVVAFGQRLISVTDYFFTVVGAAILVVTGHFMAARFGAVADITWIRWGWYLLIGSAAIWVFILIPLQIMQSQLAETFSDGGAIPNRYWTLGRIWAVFGIIATLLPMANLYIMVAKPV
ncbi:MAG: DUF2269 family protein [Pseudomonadota bacterium]|nr:DUF2269 family protein [Pseudomonadota bacterium]